MPLPLDPEYRDFVFHEFDTCIRDYVGYKTKYGASSTEAKVAFGRVDIMVRVGWHLDLWEPETATARVQAADPDTDISEMLERIMRDGDDPPSEEGPR